MQSFSTPWSIRKPYAFLMFSDGRERVHWERMNWYVILIELHKGLPNIHQEDWRFDYFYLEDFMQYLKLLKLN